MKNIIELVKGKNFILFAVCGLLLLHVITHLYQLDSRLTFGSDQIDNFNAAKNILQNHQYPLVGMVAKGNSGFNIGPLYYYYVAFFYFIFGLYPLTSIVIAFTTSLLTFTTLYIIVKKLFGVYISLIALYIFSTSSFIISSDQVQWPVNFIVMLSLLILYLLYTIIRGNEKNIFWLAVAVGVSFNIHFTSIFYAIIVVLALPLFPRNKKSLLFIVLGLMGFFVLLLPSIVFELFHKNSQTTNLTNYIATYYHGFHLTRFFQLTHDGLIEFYAILQYKIVDILNFLFPLIFFYIYLRDNKLSKLGIGIALSQKQKERWQFCYLVILWFLVPWIVFSVYKGEISNYYFAMTRPVVLIILSFITYWLVKQNNRLLSILILVFWLYFGITNLLHFFIP